MLHKLDTLEIILTTSLIVALICSIIICYQVYVLKNNHYKQLFFYLANANDIRYFSGFIFYEINKYHKQNKYYL
jgi:hypothetical protein